MAADDEKYLLLEDIDEIAAWGNDSFAGKSAATEDDAGLMSAADYAKLKGIENGAQAHKAPTSLEVTEALGYIPAAAYNAATAESDGLMSATDKSNLELLVSWKSSLVNADTTGY